MTELTVSERSQLATCEAVIAQGFKTFIEVGNALAEIRDAKLYRLTYGTFEEYCQEKWGMGQRHANRLIAAADVADDLGPIGPTLPTSESVLRPLTSLEPEARREVWQQATASAPNGKVTQAHVEATKADYQHRTQPQRTYESAIPAVSPPPVDRRQPAPTARPLGDNEVEAVIWRGITHHALISDKATSQQRASAQLYWLQSAGVGDFSRLLNPGVSFEADQMARIKAAVEADLSKQARPALEELDNDEWYTPAYILEPARTALGSIDLDPASCATANEIVRAMTFYDKSIDGLLLPWRGNIWLNPPYSDPLPWIEKLFAEYESGRLTTAIVLTNTANSPKWARLLWGNVQASACMLSSRIKFWRPDRPEPKGFDRDQMLWWVGPTTHPNSHARFRRAFADFGPFR